ncbi:hypothetical protein WME73_45695 [Sorangium sp. So ce302]|uniref:hypothetical protein n=1 Tax=Sorangium sp. So ce302 TaxID=3133297 RepID=UPI003F5E5A3F
MVKCTRPFYHAAEAGRGQVGNQAQLGVRTRLSVIVTQANLRAGLTHCMQQLSARAAAPRSSAWPARAWSVP